MSLRDQYLETIERENAELRERVALLEAELGMGIDAPLCLDLTGQETRLFGHLLKRDFVTRGSAMQALYGCRPDTEVEAKTIDVFVCKMRRKLKPFGIGIETQWGQGWFMTPQAKAAALALMPQRAAAAA